MLARIQVSDVIMSEITPVLVNILDELNHDQRVSCFVKCRVKGGENSTATIKIEKEIEKFSSVLVSEQWNIDKIRERLLKEAKQLFDKGELDGIVTGTKDLLKIKMGILPGYKFSLSVLYNTSMSINLTSGEKENKRGAYAKKKKTLPLVESTLEKIDKVLEQGLKRLKEKQEQNFSTCYFPEFFIYVDRFAVTEKYYLIDGGFLTPYCGLSPLSSQVVDMVNHFIDKELILLSKNTDYEISFDLSKDKFDIRSSYHQIHFH